MYLSSWSAPQKTPHPCIDHRKFVCKLFVIVTVFVVTSLLWGKFHPKFILLAQVVPSPIQPCEKKVALNFIQFIYFHPEFLHLMKQC